MRPDSGKPPYRDWRVSTRKLWGMSDMPASIEAGKYSLEETEKLEIAAVWPSEGKAPDAVTNIPIDVTSSVILLNAWGPGGGVDAGLLRRHAAVRNGGSMSTEAAVDAGLRWLALNQENDGHWDCVMFGGRKADVSVTGMALLAFLGAGHTEIRGKYRKNVRRAVHWLKRIQSVDGKFYIDGETYGIGYHHAIAGLAMVEAARMAKVQDTVKSAQRAVDYSVDMHQKGEGKFKLGWRYQPKSSGDITITGWFIMQLSSAKRAGLRVDPASLEGANKFLDSVEKRGADADGSDSGRHRYGYTSPEDVGVRRTAIGCLSRLALGWKREQLRGGVEWFVRRGGVPEWGENGRRVDLYYWYFGTQCLFQLGGESWKRWNKAMKWALVQNQRRERTNEGSWDPVGAYGGYWGRVGQTALGCLCLEAYYRNASLYQRLGPVAAPVRVLSEMEKATVRGCVRDLDDKEYTVRQKASRWLKKFGFRAAGYLKKQLREIQAAPNPSAEQVYRLQEIIDSL